MRKMFFRALSVCVWTFLLALFSGKPIYAEEVSESETENIIAAEVSAPGEKTHTVKKDGVTFTVTYPAVISCGSPTTFQFETTDVSGAVLKGAEYRIHSLYVHDGSEYVSVYDVSYGSNGAYTTNDTFEFTFYASGRYYIRFNTLYKNASGVLEYMDTGSYDRGIVLDIDDSAYPSVETITDTVAKECLEQCSTDYEKALWLNDWVVDNCSYDSSYSFCSAEGALARKSGTCEAYHRAYVMLLNGVGIPTGRITGNGHVWTAVKLDGKWYHVDTTWNDAGYTDSNLDLRHLYFGLNDTITTLVHSEHRPKAGYEANSLEDNYFIKSGEIMKWAMPQIETVKQHIAAKETEFSFEVKNTYYADVLYSLVAHVLTNTSWSGNDLKVEIKAEYRPQYNDDGTVDRQNGTIFCWAQYGTFGFRNIELKADSVNVGTNAQLYYALNEAAMVTVQVLDDNDRCLKTLISNASVGTDSQTVQWDLKNSSGGYVADGFYYFVITAKDDFGNNVTERKAFQVTGNRSGGVTVYNGIDYSPVYDYNYYTSKYPDIKKVFGSNGTAVLNHFVNYGMKEGRQGSNNFSVQSYWNQYVDLRRVYGSDLKSYYLHYINNGQWEGRKGTGCTQIQGAATIYNGVDYSMVYDYNYYTIKYPDIKKVFGLNDMAVLNHFVNFGMKEGRQGSNNFSVQSYRNQYADVRKVYGSDLKSYYLHYIYYGEKEGRKGIGCVTVQGATTVYKGMDYKLVYDYYYYTSGNPDIKESFGNDDQAVLAHFVNYGMREGRQGNANFNVHIYRKKYQDLKRVFGNDLQKYFYHYMNYGIKEGRVAK